MVMPSDRMKGKELNQELEETPHTRNTHHHSVGEGGIVGSSNNRRSARQIKEHTTMNTGDTGSYSNTRENSTFTI